MVQQLTFPANIVVSPRAQTILEAQKQKVFERTDRLFAALLIFEWLAGIVISLIVSPRAWEGMNSHIHVHVWYAMLLGGAICLFPAALGLTMPGQTATRHVIAVGQILMSALLIHLTGGRIETHFHLFGSLAFLAFYRDWRVLITATFVTVVDHIVRGIYWPQSIYGVASGAEWRWLEHAGWVVFEDVFLIIACRQGLNDMRMASAREAELEAMYQSAISVTEARKAGMAEVATGVLHNVGNVLNSVNVSVAMLDKKIKTMKVGGLAKAASMLLDHQDDLGTFMEHDEKGKRLPGYLFKLSDTLSDEQESMQEELSHLAKSVEHIKDIVSTHQQYAGSSNVVQLTDAKELIDDAMQMSVATSSRTDIAITSRCSGGPAVLLDKHKILQILVNLLRNAKQALDDEALTEKKIAITCEQTNELLTISVTDNGMGIAPEHLAKMFSYGFTTRQNGHGFGLHSSALSAKEMNGSIKVESDGEGMGAKFTLEIPIVAKA